MNHNYSLSANGAPGSARPVAPRTQLHALSAAERMEGALGTKAVTRAMKTISAGVAEGKELS